MEKRTDTQDSPEIEPVVLPDVASQPRPHAHAAPPHPDDGVGDGLLQEALPEVTEAARKVGGFKRLAEIAGELDQGRAGQ